MAIFGDDILWNGTVVHHATTLDKVLDYVFLVLSIILLIISCVCNPIVFWFHRQMKQNTPAVLFQILTANDFLTCILVVPVMVYYLIAGEPFEISAKVHTWQVYYSVIKGTMFCWSFSLTAILGTVRCIAINLPFCRINKALVFSIAVGMALFTLGISLGMYFEEEEHIWSAHTLHIYGRSFVTKPKITIPNILAYAKSTINMVISLSSAGLSVWGLDRADKMQKSASSDQKKRSGREAAITIAYLNILIGLQFILLIMSIVLLYGYPQELVLMNYTLFLTYPFVNTLLSAINPLVYILRCGKIRRMLLSKAGFSNVTVVSGATTV